MTRGRCSVLCAHGNRVLRGLRTGAVQVGHIKKPIAWSFAAVSEGDLLKRIFYVLTVLGIAPFVIFAGTPAHAESCAKRIERPFVVYNSLFFENQPDMAPYGMKPIHVVDRGIWAPNVPPTGPADLEMVRKYAESLPREDDPIVLDFEYYDLTKGDAEAQTGTTKLTQILKTFRKAAPDRKLGFYGYVPLRDYWSVVGARKGEAFIAWQKKNDRAAARLEKGVDAIYPSLYTFYDDEKQWVTFATAQICEARRLSSKPVYVFIWPHYHPNGASKSAPREVGGPYWRLQLETVRRLADGVVIWGGWNDQTNSRAKWNEDAAWWAETRNFMRTVEQ